MAMLLTLMILLPTSGFGYSLWDCYKPQEDSLPPFRVFSEKLHKVMFEYGLKTNSSLIYSPLTMFYQLEVTANILGRNLAGNEISYALNLCPYPCYFPNNLTSLGPCYDYDNFTMSFQHVFYFDASLTPGSVCSSISDIWSRLDFSDSSATQDVINNWYREALSDDDVIYLPTPLDPWTRVLYMGALDHTPLKEIGYFSSNKMTFTNINGQQVQVEFMGKRGQFSLVKSDDGRFMAIRDDMVGGRFSLIYVFPTGQAVDSYRHFHDLMKGKTLSEITELAFKTINTKKKNVLLPQLSLETRLNLKNVWSKFCVKSIFMRKDAFLPTFSEPFYTKEFPYTQYLHFQGDINNDISVIQDGNHDIVINKPFMFFIGDNINQAPLLSTMYLGLSDTPNKGVLNVGF